MAFYRSAVGKKWVMALTGIMLLGFVLVHMVGNLKMYLGLINHDGERVYDIDVYGEFLRELATELDPHVQGNDRERDDVQRGIDRPPLSRGRSRRAYAADPRRGRRSGERGALV